MKIGVISDTHVPTRARRLSPKVLKLFLDEQVETILHAGDIESAAVLIELETIAPVLAVRGNMDQGPETSGLPKHRFVELEGVKIGLGHGSGSPKDIARRIYQAMNRPELDLLIFGHSHHPSMEVIDGVQTFNPGSATKNYFQSRPTVGIIELNGSIKLTHHTL